MASSPPATHAASTSDVDGSSCSMIPVVRKMPEPMTAPITKSVAPQTPIARSSWASASGPGGGGEAGWVTCRER